MNTSYSYINNQLSAWTNNQHQPSAIMNRPGFADTFTTTDAGLTIAATNLATAARECANPPNIPLVNDNQNVMISLIKCELTWQVDLTELTIDLMHFRLIQQINLMQWQIDLMHLDWYKKSIWCNDRSTWCTSDWYNKSIWCNDRSTWCISD